MKKTVKILVTIVILILGLLLLFAGVEHFRGEFALNFRLKQLAAQGDKLNLNELLPPKVASEQNAALLLQSITNELHAFFDLSKSAPLTMTLVKPGQAFAAWQQDTWEIDKITSNSWNVFGPQIAAANQSLTKLETLWAKNGYDDGYDYREGFTGTNVNWMLITCKQTSILLSEATENDLRRGDLESARKHLRSLLAIIKALGTTHLIINQLVDEACANYAWCTTWSALQADGWTDSQLADLQFAWETTTDFPSAMEKSCELERAMTLDYFRQIRGSEPKARAQLEMFESVHNLIPEYSSGPPTHGIVLQYIHLPLWRMAWAAQDELRALDKWKPLMEAGKKEGSGSWLEVKDKFSSEELKASVLGLGINPPDKVGFYDRCRFLFSIQPFSLTGSTLLRPMEAETEKNMAIKAIALKRYEMRHGKPAKELLNLVPEFLKTMPIDRMDGKPLRYKLNEEGTYTLYSVGLDGTDDGGNPQPEKSLDKFRNIWQGRDAVWPTAKKTD